MFNKKYSQIKYIINLSLAVFIAGLFFVKVNEAQAAMVSIKKTGEVVVNVLAAQDSIVAGSQPESLKISQSSVQMGNANLPISLLRKDGKYILNIAGKDGEQNFDITNYKESILQIEERPSVRTINISLAGNQFVIEQAGVKAMTPYQINIDPTRQRITILTPTGYKFLSLLPADAVNILYRSNIITSLVSGSSVEISEDSGGNLYYQASGTKTVGIKDLYMFNAPVTAKISAVNGEVLEVNQPIWLKILSLFTLQT